MVPAVNVRLPCGMLCPGWTERTEALIVTSCPSFEEFDDEEVFTS